MGHRFRLMRPHSHLAAKLPGEYPESINVAIARYLAIASASLPDFSDAEWQLLRDACTGWKTQKESPDSLKNGLLYSVGWTIDFSHESPDRKYGIDCKALRQKIAALTMAEAIAVIHAVE